MRPFLVIGAVLAVLAATGACAGPGHASGSIGVDGPPVPVASNIRYATVSPTQTLDIYRPPGDPRALPLVIEIHGGAFIGGDKAADADRQIIGAMVRRGFAVASVNYRLSGEAPFPAGVKDVKAAVRWLRAHAGDYRLAPERFGAIGESAGGYLAVMLATTANTSVFDDDALGNPGVSSAVQAAVDWWGPIDFATMDTELRLSSRCPKTASYPGDDDSPYSAWLGAPLRTIPDTVRAADPVTYLPAVRTLPPVLIEHGDTDCTVPYQQSQALARALTAIRKGPVRVDILRGAGHGSLFPVASRLPSIADFFDQTLAPRDVAPPYAAPAVGPAALPAVAPK